MPCSPTSVEGDWQGVQGTANHTGSLRNWELAWRTSTSSCSSASSAAAAASSRRLRFRDAPLILLTVSAGILATVDLAGADVEISPEDQGGCGGARDGTKGAKCGHVLSLCLYGVAVAIASWRNYRETRTAFWDGAVRSVLA